MRTLNFAVMLLLLGLPSASAQEKTLDGNFWGLLNRQSRAALSVGLIEGVKWAAPFLISRDGLFTTPVENAFNAIVPKYIVGKNPDLLREGIDAFYKDVRNRKIPVGNAAVIVFSQLAGEPEAQITALVERMRTEATK